MVKKSTKPAGLFFVGYVSSPGKLNMSLGQLVGGDLIVLFDVFWPCHSTNVKVVLLLIYEDYTVSLQI